MLTTILALALQAGIRVTSDDWGGASRTDIRKVLESALAAYWKSFPGRALPGLEIHRSKSTPITLFERGPKGEIRIGLNVEGMFWAQFAYQFSHELCHVACRFREDVNPNQWLEETLCETASLDVLGRLSKSWASEPPYPNWRSFAPQFTTYREERLSKLQAPADFTAWFREQEPALRKNPALRDLNTLMAARLLPLFEAEPGMWASVGALNSTPSHAEQTLAERLQGWSGSAEPAQRPFVRKVAAVFGVVLVP
jgi:hypothetical protein